MVLEAESVTHPQIPDKLFFKIGEVAELTGTKPHDKTCTLLGGFCL